MPTQSRQRPPRRRKPAAAPHASPAKLPTEERLQKVMAAAGIGSRRHCEELILAGRVEVDRKTVTELGTKVDISSQEIRLDGVVLGRSRKLYYLVNKPMGAVSTNFDPSGRPRVIDLVPQTKERLFTVGRLDLSSEGLILVTNDGELANRLAHPRYGVEKTYQVLVAGTPEPAVFEQLRQGIHLAEGPAHVVSVRVKSRQKKSTVLEIVLNEGRNREIRRLLAKVGHKVLRLKRIAFGPVRLKDLEPGDCRRLSGEELRTLRYATRHQAERGTQTESAGLQAPERSDAATAPKSPRGPKKTESSRRKPAAGRAPKRFGRGPKRVDSRAGRPGR